MDNLGENMRKKKHCITFCFVFIFITYNSIFGQDLCHKVIKQNVSINARATDIESVLQAISFVTPVPIGFESSAVNGAIEKVDLTISNQPVDFILNGIIKQLRSYKWDCHEGVINIYPITGSNKLFDVKVKELKVENVLDKDLGMVILGLPEIASEINELQLKVKLKKEKTYSLKTVVASPNIKPPIITVSFQSNTFREILNKLLKEYGVIYWSLIINSKDKTIYLSLKY